MPKPIIHILAVCILGCLSAQATAHKFGAALDATWHLEPSTLQCRLWQTIPQYGIAVFEIDSGEELSFYLEADRPSNEVAKADVVIAAPYWRPGLEDRELGQVVTTKGNCPVKMGEHKANRMVDELTAGMAPTIRIQNESHPIEVVLSGVNFQDAYNGLLSCFVSLYPANYSQLEDTFLLFGSNKYGISAVSRKRLDLIAGYLNADPSVSHIYVYGHTDTMGRRGHNWELSRLRAKEVKDYLVKKGVDPDMITTNFYGETRPRYKEKSAKERSLNRRVYIHLKRSS